MTERLERYYKTRITALEYEVGQLKKELREKEKKIAELEGKKLRKNNLDDAFVGNEGLIGADAVEC